jgi:hypothetical protein
MFQTAYLIDGHFELFCDDGFHVAFEVRHWGLEQVLRWN